MALGGDFGPKLRRLQGRRLVTREDGNAGCSFHHLRVPGLPGHLDVVLHRELQLAPVTRHLCHQQLVKEVSVQALV